ARCWKPLHSLPLLHQSPMSVTAESPAKAPRTPRAPAPLWHAFTQLALVRWRDYLGWFALRAANGHAAALPSPAMKSRRRICAASAVRQPIPDRAPLELVCLARGRQQLALKRTAATSAKRSLSEEKRTCFAHCEFFAF